MSVACNAGLGNPAMTVAEVPARALSDGLGTEEELSAMGLPLVNPDDYQLAPGELSYIDRDGPLDPADTYLEPEDCVRAGFDVSWRTQRGGYLREILTAKSYDVAIESPLVRAEALSTSLGVNFLLKREDVQPVKSFKLRGAYNRMARLSREELSRGVICSSAGNHAQGVALAARALGCSAAVCMPTSTPGIKVDAVRALGGAVELVGDTYSETAAHALARAAREGRVFIPPYDDPYVIAGQGTIASEVLRQTSMDALDAVFVAIGGGGLAAGIASYIKALKPAIKVIGVEPAGANAMAQSLARGRRVELRRVDVFADGVAVKVVGAETFRLCRSLLDGVILVDNAAVSTAIKDVFNETRSILEPSGAVAVAGAKAWLAAAAAAAEEEGAVRDALTDAPATPRARGVAIPTVVAITSGANMNFDQLRVVSELAGVGEVERECMLATTIPEQPGAFLKFLRTAIPDDDVAVTEFKYRYASPARANILFSLGAAPASRTARDAIARLCAAGMPTRDLSRSELALVHLRHLVGGLARTADGAPLANERIFQVDVPEIDGALARLISVLCPTWNISLFHYRRTGLQASRTLLGLQVPHADDEAFAERCAELEDQFAFKELEGETLDLFAMFMQ